jgi:predicted MFS family arabinose efflux permease/quinol monooxygenase YgiN
MLWVATLVSSIGTWMHDIGAGWLMTSLSSSPVMVAMVQAATTLPIFVLAMPAGALADIVDRRRYLLVVQLWLALVAALLAVLTLSDSISAWGLVALTFAMGTGAALMMPAWAAVTPEIVAKEQLHTAIALNSMGINVARAIGPALAGYIVTLAGTGAVFALNALSYVGVILVLLQWQRHVPASELPTERFIGALRAGLRFARHSLPLQAAIIRGSSFMLFASASWALLPLIARNLPDGGPESFGALVASMGVGAVTGAFILPGARRRVSPDALVMGASTLYAAALFCLAFMSNFLLLCLVMALSGVAWISILSTFQVAAQMALPDWVRSRGLAVFMAIFMGAMAAGSLLWGKVAELWGISAALGIAACGTLLVIVVTRRIRISALHSAEMSPSMHWPTPDVHAGITHDRGPVLVTIDYKVRPDSVQLFLAVLRELSRHRRRDGAFLWSVFEDAEQPNHFIETFAVESWLEHLRQHERVTGADRDLQAQLRNYLVADNVPVVKHYVAP